MKALSIHPYYAMMIVSGHKTVEVRTWKTPYRGPVLICATNRKIKGFIPGHALGVVDLVDIVPLKREHIDAALLENEDYDSGLFAWILKNPRYIKPIPLKGHLSLWTYDGDVEYLPVAKTDEEDQELFYKYWKPIII